MSGCAGLAARLAEVRAEFDAGRPLAEMLAERRERIQEADAQVLGCTRGHRIPVARAALITGHRLGALRLALLSWRLSLGW